MSLQVASKYCAFLSYAHADEKVATDLHLRLELFHFDPSFISRQVPGFELVSKSLFPFADKNIHAHWVSDLKRFDQEITLIGVP